MPGSWEIKDNRRVLCGILHTDMTTMAWSFGLRNLIIPGEIIPIAGMPYDHARNTACQMTIQHGFEWLFFLDSDVVPPRDAILRLMAHNKPLVSGVYFRRSPPHGVPVMMKPVGQWITNFPPNSLIEVDVVGAGCLLIHRTLLEAIQHVPQRGQAGKVWFDWRVDCQGILQQGECLSEDFTLCTHVKRQFGIPVLVDTGVVCLHVGLGEASYGKFAPCEARTKT